MFSSRFFSGDPYCPFESILELSYAPFTRAFSPLLLGLFLPPIYKEMENLSTSFFSSFCEPPSPPGKVKVKVCVRRFLSPFFFRFCFISLGEQVTLLRYGERWSSPLFLFFSLLCFDFFQLRERTLPLSSWRTFLFPSFFSMSRAIFWLGGSGFVFFSPLFCPPPYPSPGLPSGLAENNVPCRKRLGGCSPSFFPPGGVLFRLRVNRCKLCLFRQFTISFFSRRYFRGILFR